MTNVFLNALKLYGLPILVTKVIQLNALALTSFGFNVTSFEKASMAPSALQVFEGAALDAFNAFEVGWGQTRDFFELVRQMRHAAVMQQV